MGSRLNLQTILEATLGSRNVYFQPPESIKLRYPCIIYEKVASNVLHADGIKYKKETEYTLTLIDTNPDSEIPDRLEALNYCSQSNFYTAENLNHFVFKLFY